MNGDDMTCHCGCGATVERDWAQGHDARAMYRTIREHYPSHAAFLAKHDAKGAASTVVVERYGSVLDFVNAHAEPNPEPQPEPRPEPLNEVEAALARWVAEEVEITSSPRWLQGQATPEEIARVDELWRKQDNPREALETERAAEAERSWAAAERERKDREARAEREAAWEATRRRNEEAARVRRLAAQQEAQKRAAKDARKTRKARERRMRAGQPWDHHRIATVFGRVPLAVGIMALSFAEANANPENGIVLIVGLWAALLALTLLGKHEAVRWAGWILLAAPFALFAAAFALVALMGAANGGKK